MKKFLSVALALVMALSLSIPAFAADIEAADGSAAVPVTVTTPENGDLTFKVTMPTAMPIAVDKDGVVTVADNLQIENLSAGAVKVSNMSIAGANGWATADYDTNFGKYAVNSAILAMEILEQKTTGADAIAFDATKFVNDSGDNYMWAGIGNGETAAHNTIALPYAAKVAAQNTPISGTTVADVTYTVAWYVA